MVETVKETGLVYMVGETSYYYPATIYCRNRFQAGDFGHFVYGEAEYIHDMDVGFYDAYRYSGGADWKRTASFPPMLYPTHSVSMILSTTGARMTDVACFGYVDQEEDGVFKAEVRPVVVRDAHTVLADAIGAAEMNHGDSAAANSAQLHLLVILPHEERDKDLCMYQIFQMP